MPSIEKVGEAISHAVALQQRDKNEDRNMSGTRDYLQITFFLIKLRNGFEENSFTERCEGSGQN